MKTHATYIIFVLNNPGESCYANLEIYSIILFASVLREYLTYVCVCVCACLCAHIDKTWQSGGIGEKQFVKTNNERIKNMNLEISYAGEPTRHLSMINLIILLCL